VCVQSVYIGTKILKRVLHHVGIQSYFQ